MMENPKTEYPGGEKRTILVVDDEPDFIIYMVALLEENGYKVRQARSSKEAFDLMQQCKPDLISLDIMMPKKSGIAFYREFKLNEKFKDIPAIFLSAFSQARDFTGKGFRKLVPDEDVPEPAAYLEKPLQAQRLLDVIKDILG